MNRRRGGYCSIADFLDESLVVDIRSVMSHGSHSSRKSLLERSALGGHC